jgi:hypothetical protein
MLVILMPLTGDMAEERSIPILYTTDLYHPPDDPDDHFDLATLFAMPEFDILAVVIDRGERGAERPGIIPLKQLMHMTGREIPFAYGLIDNLISTEDTAGSQIEMNQTGVRLILDSLENATRPVTIFTTGSLRDVAVAYNRTPELFHEKVSRLYINAGHSSGREEWNVKLDPRAYVCMMRSRLPIYWVPCFGDKGYSSFWKFKQSQILDHCSLALQNYVVYALTKEKPELHDPIPALSLPISDETKEKIWNLERSMWCTAAFLHAAGRTNPTFTFKKMPVQIDDEGVTHITTEEKGISIHTIYREDVDAYSRSMRESLRRLLMHLKTVQE